MYYNRVDWDVFCHDGAHYDEKTVVIGYDKEWGDGRMCDLQKANMWKRISAALCDFIALSIVAVGVAFILSLILGFDGNIDRLEKISEGYETQFGVDFRLPDEDYQNLSDAEKELYEQAMDAFSADPEANYVFSLLINHILIMLTIGTLTAFFLLEFIVPLLFGNGQTLGKKVFGVALMHENHVKIKPFALFVRAILGKYTIETLVPIYVFIMILFGALGIVGVIVLLGLPILQLVVIAASKTNSTIHDLVSHTVCVDYASQMIFEDADALVRYKAERAREAAEQSDN